MGIFTLELAWLADSAGRVIAVANPSVVTSKPAIEGHLKSGQ